MAFTMAVIGNEIIGQRDFQHVAEDIFQDATTGDIVIIEPGTDQALLIQRTVN